MLLRRAERHVFAERLGFPGELFPLGACGASLPVLDGHIRYWSVIHPTRVRRGTGMDRGSSSREEVELPGREQKFWPRASAPYPAAEGTEGEGS